MLSKVMNMVGVLMALAALSTAAYAEKSINVQGKLTELSGGTTIYAQGQKPVKFSLYNANNTIVWQQDQQITFNSGLFNVPLKGQGVLGTPPFQYQNFEAIPFDQLYTLGIKVGTDSEMAPRQTLAAAAYALGSLGDFNVACKLNVGGDASFSTAGNSDAKILLKGPYNRRNFFTWADSSGSGGYCGMGQDLYYAGWSLNFFAVGCGANTSPRIDFVTGTESNNSVKMSVLNNGRVSIGNTNPSELLTVGAEGNTATDRRALSFLGSGFAAPGNFCANSNGDKLILFRNYDGSFQGDATIGVGEIGDMWFKSNIQRFFGYNSGVATERLRITGNGGVELLFPGLAPGQAAGFHLYGGDNYWKMGWQYRTDGTGGWRASIPADSNPTLWSFDVQGVNNPGNVLSTILRARGDGNVGIGTASPATTLHVVRNAPNGYSEPLLVHNPGTNAAVAGSGAAININNGVVLKSIVDDYQGLNGGQSFEIWNEAGGGNWYNRFKISKNGHVMIGYTTPYNNATFSVNGCGYAAGGWSQPSDMRFKTNIKDFSENVVEKIGKLKAIRYNWDKEKFKEMMPLPKKYRKHQKENADGKNEEVVEEAEAELPKYLDEPQIGISAQELEKEYPELVTTGENGNKSVFYDKLTVVLLEAVNQQQKAIAELQKQIHDLKSK